MKKLFFIAFGATLVLSLLSSAASAAPKSNTPSYLGNDISWPQCGKVLPTNQAFGIVGVNGGLATTTNKCLTDQLKWAARSTGVTSQAKIQLYVNTANPGEIINQVTTWPTNNIDKTGTTAPNPYGTCDGTNSLACSWQYGWNRAVEDVIDRFAPAASAASIDPNPAAYTWWLDVETENTWQTSSTNYQAKNAATSEGMTAYFQSLGAKVGLYSTNVQWTQINGSQTGISGNLIGLDNWRAGARNLTGAKSNCSLSPLTPNGHVVLTQFVSNSLDYNYSCKG